MYKLATAATVRAASLEDVKLHLRVDHDSEDTLLLNLIDTATADIETMSGHVLTTQTWDLYLDAFPAGDVIDLLYPPLQSVTGVYYTPVGASEATLSSSNYRVDTVNAPGRIQLKSTGAWPADELEVNNGVRVRFVAGFGSTATSVPAKLRQALLLLIAHYYEHREAVMDTNRVMALPHGVAHLVADWRARIMRY
jgi:uncharacterized phiE125 gp8 family phage protein